MWVPRTEPGSEEQQLLAAEPPLQRPLSLLLSSRQARSPRVGSSASQAPLPFGASIMPPDGSGQYRMGRTGSVSWRPRLCGCREAICSDLQHDTPHSLVSHWTLTVGLCPFPGEGSGCGRAGPVVTWSGELCGLLSSSASRQAKFTPWKVNLRALEPVSKDCQGALWEAGPYEQRSE